MTELPTLWCRFCKDETKQIVDADNAAVRVCIRNGCWRRQSDGLRVRIADGERFSQPARDSRPPSSRPPLPPPPHVPHDAYQTAADELRADLLDALRRIAEIEHGLVAMAERMEQIRQALANMSNGTLQHHK